MATKQSTGKESLRTRASSDNLQERTRRATRQFLRWLPWAILNVMVAGASITFGTLMFIGTVLTLVIFSPVLVPASILLFFTVGSGLAIVAVGSAVMSACYGLYMHIKASYASENAATKNDQSKVYHKQALAAAGA